MRCLIGKSMDVSTTTSLSDNVLDIPRISAKSLKTIAVPGKNNLRKHRNITQL